MAVLDEESGIKVEIEKQSEGTTTTKASSLATMGRGEEDAEMGKETAVVATSRPQQQGTDSGTEDGGDGESDDGLPMSRARCIALVATVTGAAFLNVSELNVYADTYTTPCIPYTQLHKVLLNNS